MGVFSWLGNRFGRNAPIESNENTLPGEVQKSTEAGARATPENQVKYLYQMMYVDGDRRSTVLDIRQMDREDPRVKKIHTRMARTAVKGGLELEDIGKNKKVKAAWLSFVKRLHLNRQEKLESDARGLVMEGNLALQWAINQNNQVSGCIRMPTETLNANVNPNGVFKDVRQAYDQYDLSTGMVQASFALWQLTMGRINPDNYDDWGSFGRPYLDATRTVFKQLRMTEEDLVIRRRTRAPQKNVHILENADEAYVETYKNSISDKLNDVQTDFFIKGKGDVKALQGDASLDQIADVAYLLDTFFAGAPAPKGLFGYVGDLNRDILEDLKRDYFDEIDGIQDILSSVYEQGFRLQLLFNGIDPDQHNFRLKFRERKTDTPNQRVDHALKLQALGASDDTAFRAAGLNPDDEGELLDKQKERFNPYPGQQDIPTKKPALTITPGNAKKGDSAMDIGAR